MATRIGSRMKVALAAISAVFTGECPHDFRPKLVGKTLNRKGFRPGVKAITVVGERCTLCGALRAEWVRSGSVGSRR